MLIIPPPTFRKRRGRIKPRKTQAPVAPLALVEAEFMRDQDPPLVRLVFGRAIDGAGIEVGQIVVDDGPETGTRFVGSYVDAHSGATVFIGLAAAGSAEGSQTVLDASAETGIVAVDDGAAWGGVTDLELPFP